jgi:ABC-2 type transport system permease protein
MSISLPADALPVEGDQTVRLDPQPKYLSLARAALHRSITYRNTTIINIGTALIWVAVYYYLWRSVFAASPVVERFTWDRMRTYVLLAYGVNSLFSFYTEARMFNVIRTGEVAVDLMRPADFLTAQFAQACGDAVVEGLFGFVSTLLLGLLVFDAAPPASPAAAALFALSVGLGFVVKFLISYLTGLLCFWTTSFVGLLWARGAVTNVLSGALIPLAFFPDWLRTAAQIAPFQAIVATPITIYLGDLAGAAAWLALGIQAAWAAALWVVARLAWGPASRALTVQGG